MTHSNGSVIAIDALVVGAGFSGTWLLHRLLQEGFQAKLVDRCSDFGGVWHSHSFPGCRTDSPVPLYEFSDPLLWKEWVWTQRFPDSNEICEYFKFAADKWQLREHALFNQFVDRAEWNESDCRWSVSTREGLHFSAKFFLPCIGWASRSYTPDWPGKETFRGEFLHSSTWRDVEPGVGGKKIAVIGTGASGVQLVQTLCKVAESVVLFQRSPAIATPTRQVTYAPGRRHQSDQIVSKILADRKTFFAGLDFDAGYHKTFEHDDERRRTVYQDMWDLGDYHFSHGSYMDMMFDEAANLEAYKFWRNKTQAKITDPKLKELLAPTNPPHPYAGKHIPLEDGYFEAFNRQNVHLVDLNTTPIECLTERGITTTEKEWDFDLIIAATGYDTFTGGLLQIDIRGKDGLPLSEKWKDGVKTNFGLFSEGFPNMMILYGPQAPTPFCNGPTCAEVQGDWVVDLIKHMRQSDRTRVETDIGTEGAWTDNIAVLGGMSLLPKTKSFYFGDNIPGKRREFLAYLGGLPTYIKLIRECADAGYSGFTLK